MGSGGFMVFKYIAYFEYSYECVQSIFVFYGLSAKCGFLVD